MRPPEKTLSWILALPAALIAALHHGLHFIGALCFGGGQAASKRLIQDGENTFPVLVHTFYVVPTYTFRKEANVVIDSLTYVTNEVTLTLWMAKDKRESYETSKFGPVVSSRC